MEPPRVHLTAYGCQMNRLDAEVVAEVLREGGAEVVADPADANVLLLVTCAVRRHAEDRVFSHIGALAPRKRREPGLVVGLLGCMAQAHGRQVRSRAPLVDLVCSPGRLADLPDLIAQARAGRPAVALDPPRGEAGRPDACPAPDAASDIAPGPAPRPGPAEMPPGAVPGPADAPLDAAEVRRPLAPDAAGRACVTAMRGCDNFCAYCVVPCVRGPERSRPPSLILEEVRRLVGQGARQITLLGQAVNQYAARETGRAWDLADLLAAAAETPGLWRLSFITSHPRAMTPRLAAVFRDVPAVCPYLHMPAQSGSDAVLARMNRGYTAAEYLDRLAQVRDARADLAIVSDFIVGFPGETGADFQATADLVRQARLAGAFVFKYSPRPGTAAARRYADDVPADEKRRRNLALLAVVQETAAQENRRLVGREVRVLVEGPSPRPNLHATDRPAGQQQLRGRTPCQRLVVFDGPPSLTAAEVTVRILDAGPLTLFAELST